jgi:hypothetical protein
METFKNLVEYTESYFKDAVGVCEFTNKHIKIYLSEDSEVTIRIDEANAVYAHMIMYGSNAKYLLWAYTLYEITEDILNKKLDVCRFIIENVGDADLICDDKTVEPSPQLFHNIKHYIESKYGGLVDVNRCDVFGIEMNLNGRLYRISHNVISSRNKCDKPNQGFISLYVDNQIIEQEGRKYPTPEAICEFLFSESELRKAKLKLFTNNFENID